MKLSYLFNRIINERRKKKILIIILNDLAIAFSLALSIELYFKQDILGYNIAIASSIVFLSASETLDPCSLRFFSVE